MSYILKRVKRIRAAAVIILALTAHARYQAENNNRRVWCKSYILILEETDILKMSTMNGGIQSAAKDDTRMFWHSFRTCKVRKRKSRTHLL